MHDSDPVAFLKANFLNELRKALQRLRGPMRQSEVAQRTHRNQSEVSRLENGLAGNTRIGTVLDYIQACDGDVTLTLLDKNGERSSSR